MLRTQFVSSLFGSVYICEQLCSEIKTTPSVRFHYFRHERFENLLKISKTLIDLDLFDLLVTLAKNMQF